MSMKITNIEENSPAFKAGITINDTLLEINDNKINDIIDYQFYSSDENLFLKLFNQKKEIYSVRIYNPDYYDLGIEFQEMKIKNCQNKCIFCFVDQLPKNLRRTLYVKDDDYRTSFLDGNYITLTNLSEKDFKRIAEMKLSPLYISVHTVNPKLRKFMLKNPKAERIMDYIKFLTNQNIELHTQAVLCPEINDGCELDRTIHELSSFFPKIQSLAVVPAGLTDFRDKLPSIRLYNKQEAEEIVQKVSRYNSEFRKKLGQGFVYASDEFYVVSNTAIPDDSYYDNYVQIENGVGMIRQELDEFMYIAEEFKDEFHKLKNSNKKITIITGESAYKYILEIFSGYNELIDNDIFSIEKIENNFFGKEVTVSGLIAGQDIIDQLRSRKRDLIVLPENIVNYDNLLIDSLSVNELSKALRTEAKIFNQYDLFHYLLDI